MMCSENFSFCVRNHPWCFLPNNKTGNTIRREVGRAIKKEKTVGILCRICLFMLSVVFKLKSFCMEIERIKDRKCSRPFCIDSTECGKQTTLGRAENQSLLASIGVTLCSHRIPVRSKVIHCLPQWLRSKHGYAMVWLLQRRKIKLIKIAGKLIISLRNHIDAF